MTPEQLENRRETQRRWYRNNREKRLKKIMEWRANNKERCREHDRACKKRNAHKIKNVSDETIAKRRAACLKWKHLHPEKSRELSRLFRINNPDKIRMCGAARRARMIGVLHPDHDKKEEAILIAERRRLEGETGVRHAVDHIIPISRGGWHHHENLQVMPFGMNSRKGDSVGWSEPGYKSWMDVSMDLWPWQFLRDLANLKVS